MTKLQVIINPSGISYADSYKQQLELFDRAIEACLLYTSPSPRDS